jgi:hypothetical protein
MHMAEPAAPMSSMTPVTTVLQTKCAKCEEEELRREATAAGPAVAPPIVHEVLASPG